jgi:Holliday junction resolvase RusA-like endonuclease
MSGWTLADIEARPNIKLSTPLRFKPAADVVAIQLPIPPSVNACWANVEGMGRVRSTAYRRWSKLAMQELQAQQAGRIAGKFAVVITAGRVKRRCDIDNRIKAVLDLLAGVVTEDDAMCECVSAGWSDDVKSGKINVQVRAVK